MAQISEHINNSNKNIHSYDQLRKNIVNLGSEKGNNSYNYSTQLTCLHNSLLISIAVSPENYLSNVEGKSDMIKICTSLLKSYAAL